MILLRLTGLNYYHMVLVVNVWLGEQSEISCLMWVRLVTRSDIVTI